MVKKVVTLRPDQGVFDAIEILLRNRISGAPVLDENSNCLGVFSEKNCMSVLLSGSYHRLPHTTVGEFCARHPKTITEDTDILTIGQIFLRTSVRRLPVLREGRLVGIVCRKNILRAMSTYNKRQAAPTTRPPHPLYLSAVDDDRKTLGGL